MSGLSVAIDAGTSFIKVLVLDEHGTEVASASRRTAIRHPRPERSEQDMLEVREAVFTCITEAVRGLDRPVERLVVTAQGDGAWLVDRAGDPVGPAVLWNDGRSTDVLREWERDGVLERAFRLNGSLGNLGLPHAILSWMHRHEPDALQTASAVLTCGSWLHLALTGSVGLHPTEASAPWLDARTGGVSDELIDLYGLDWARPLIPRVLTAEQVTAPLLRDVAERIGLPAGLPVTLAPYDVVATAIGSGAVAPGDAFCILGTTLCVGVLRAEADTTGVPAGLTILDGPGRPVVRAFPTLAGTGVVDWATDLLGLEHAAELTELAAAAPPGASGVRVWPYLSPAGERAPFLDAAASGVIGGLSFDTGRAEIARAVIEGLAHVIRDCLDAARTTPGSLSLAGGGAASDLWCSTVADVTGVPTTRRLRGQEGARGAIAAALVAEGGAPGLAAAVAAVAPAGTAFEPDPERAAAASLRHEDFIESRDALATRWGSWRQR